MISFYYHISEVSLLMHFVKVNVEILTKINQYFLSKIINCLVVLDIFGGPNMLPLFVRASTKRFETDIDIANCIRQRSVIVSVFSHRN